MDALMAPDAVHVLGNHDRTSTGCAPFQPTLVFRDQVLLCHAGDGMDFLRAESDFSIVMA
jgi:hypothetical protein